MDSLPSVVEVLPKLPIDHLNALIALGAICLSAFAIYVVLVIVRDFKK